MKKNLIKTISLLFLILPIYLTFFANKNQVKAVGSGYFSSLRDTLSTSQLSYFGRCDAVTNSPSIDMWDGDDDLGDAPSMGAENLFIGDTLTIDSVGESDTYSITDKLSTTLFLNRNVTTEEGAMVIATRSAVHTISFMPQTNLTGGMLQFIIKATDLPGETADDGIPDQGGFDRNGVVASDITCPGGGATYNEYMWIDTINEGMAFDGTYFIVMCPNVTLHSGTMAEVIIGKENGHKLINPSPGRDHIIGQASTLTSGVYYFAVAVLDPDTQSLVGIDTAKVILTENVRVTATVEPIITFTIGTSGATSVGSTLCGSPIGNKSNSGQLTTNVTSSYVNFGQLDLDSHNNLAQTLSLVTNTTNGYVIQTYENEPLSAGDGNTLPDTTCEGGTCSAATAGAWTGHTQSGFGYSLEAQNITGNLGNVSLGITTTGNYKAFGVGTSNAQPVLSRSDIPNGTDSIYVCYRVVAGNDQLPGTYENSISYIATVIF